MVIVNKKFAFLIAGIAILASMIALHEQNVESLSTPMQQMQNTYAHVPVNLAIGKSISVLNTPLTQLAISTTGGGYVPYEVHSKVITDHNVTLALYNGTTVNGTLIAEMATNVGLNNVTIAQMDLNGGFKSGPEYRIVMDKKIVGCVQDQPFAEKITTTFSNGTTVSHTVNTVIKCGQIASHAPIILKPGESLTAYLVGTMDSGSIPVNNFSGGVAYSVGNSHEYNMQLPIETVK